MTQQVFIDSDLRYSPGAEETCGVEASTADTQKTEGFFFLIYY